MIRNFNVLDCPGLFIVLEGPDCCGKTTQHEKVAKHFEATGLKVIRTREQGGTPYAEKIRTLCKTPSDGEPKHELTQLLLAYASRNQHLNEVIIPALRRGDVVISDRFNLSSLVFQSIVGGVPREDWATVDTLVVGLVEPHATFIFGVTAETARQRHNARAEQDAQPDYYDDKDEHFHSRIAEAYRHLPGIRIDGNGSPDEVFELLRPDLDRFIEKLKTRNQ